MTTSTTDITNVAVVTGGSHGLGRAISTALVARGWAVVTDGRDPDALATTAKRIDSPLLTTVTGDVTDPRHRHDLIDTASRLGTVSLLVNNASRLGPSPQPKLRDYPEDELRAVYDANLFAPLALAIALLPALAETAGAIVNISSDAAVEAYNGWGGYGSSKAALDQLTAVLAVEESAIDVYSFDPGDMRTLMHQQAFPGEDISDRPEPETVVPALERLLDERPPSGRFRNSDLEPIGASS
ncbi:MAG TPA: SDR family oxidoreductase [Mycobacteriales bacterium]|nr:SDR family oxidoreductase [Mycobacteriales bacterium]